MNDLLTNGSLVAVVVALNALAGKYIGSKWLPLSAIGFGVAGSLLIGGFSPEAGLMGIIIGLSACGLYDQSKILKK